MSATGNRTTISVLSGDQTSLDATTRIGWEGSILRRGGLYALYQSPTWWEHLQATVTADELALAITCNEGVPQGVVPVQIGQCQLDFIVRRRKLLRFALPAMILLGGEPLLPPDPDVHDRLFLDLFRAFPQCEALYLKSVPTSSYCWQHCRPECWRNKEILLHDRGRPRPFHWIELPNAFEEYLAKFTAKQRYNLKREVRLLTARGDGRLELRRVERAVDVPLFLQDAGQAYRRSWQFRELGPQSVLEPSQPQRLSDLARRGILRCYSLTCGDEPCAFVLGYQFHGVYHAVEIAYDQMFAEYSPGAVLFYLMIEDLISCNRPDCVHFGIGDSDYKRRFANRHDEDASILLLRNTASNRVRSVLHRAFGRLRGSAKAWLQPGDGKPD